METQALSYSSAIIKRERRTRQQKCSTMAASVGSWVLNNHRFIGHHDVTSPTRVINWLHLRVKWRLTANCWEIPQRHADVRRLKRKKKTPTNQPEFTNDGSISKLAITKRNKRNEKIKEQRWNEVNLRSTKDSLYLQISWWFPKNSTNYLSKWSFVLGHSIPLLLSLN